VTVDVGVQDLLHGFGCGGGLGAWGDQECDVSCACPPEEDGRPDCVEEAVFDLGCQLIPQSAAAVV
jgi:hypothetical protein